MQRAHTREFVPRRTVTGSARRSRGVSSVLAMMYLVIFGSLAAAMAVVAQGNLRTADSGLRVSRAMSAAETGLAFAARRLGSEARRFVTEKGTVDFAFGHDLWLGSVNEGEDGPIVVLEPDGYSVATPPDGIGEGVRDAHLADSVDMTIIVEAGDGALPSFNDVTGTLLCRPILMSAEANAPYFRLRYDLVEEEALVRVTSIGTDGTISRTLQLDFRIGKKIEYAVISPSRIMIGKNVRIEGPMGTRYGLVAGELDSANGDPLIMRSDFYHLDAGGLDPVLDTFFDVLAANDVDGDGRLRPAHILEGDGIGDYDDLTDYNGDEYIDEFDLFLAHYDDNDDIRVVYDSDLAAAAGIGGATNEFTVDLQLARLIDEWKPDRNEDGEIDSDDTVLGYRNGIIDSYDRYAKVHGRLAFAVERSTWEAEHGDTYQTVVHGAIRPDGDDPAVAFDVPEEELREITTDMFGDSQDWFDTESLNGDSFQDQVNAAIAGGGGAAFVASADAPWESVPFEAQGAYDYYQRPIYRNMQFQNARIPLGLNALFEDCVFIGVTYVETSPDCAHENWNYAGAVQPVGDPVTYELKYPYLYAEDGGGTTIPDTKVVSNNIRFHNCTFLGSVAGDRPDEYTHWRNKLQYTGNTRFYVDPEDEDLDGQADGAALTALLEAMDDADLDELAKSSILMPGWSVDVGNFNNDQAADPEDTPSVRLKGTIVAGILDVRGTADVFGTLLMTFRPEANAGPLYYGGMPDAFNTTIGYFGPADGDGEGVDAGGLDGFGEITLRYDPDAELPDGIPWPVSMEAVADTYVEGGDG